MSKQTLHFSIGENIGRVLLDMAQNFLENCEFDKAFEVYTKGFQGLTKEHALEILKGNCVLVCSGDCSVTLTDDQKIVEENKQYITDWWYLVGKLIEQLDNARSSVWELKKKMRNYYVDLNDVNLSLVEVSLAYTNIVARFIAGEDLDVGRFQMFYRLLDQGDFEYDSLTKDKQIVYCVVRYIECMRYMYKDFIRLSKLYDFLLQHEMIQHYPMIEHTLENILMNHLDGYLDKENSYHHALCNEELLKQKEQMMEEVLSTKWGKEFYENGIIAKNMMDKYDAGFLAPDGTFYGLMGETRELLHVQLCDMLAEKLYPEIKTKTSDEYELMKKGIMKIHHDNVYGYFAYSKETAEKEGMLYCPTEVQVNAIYEYANKFYGGKINVSGTGTHYVSVASIRQMDEIALRQVFD